MPLFRVGRDGWKYGKSGKVYRGAYAYDMAVRQCRAIHASINRRKPHILRGGKRYGRTTHRRTVIRQHRRRHSKVY